jgi:hypothetical protein
MVYGSGSGSGYDIYGAYLGIGIRFILAVGVWILWVQDVSHGRCMDKKYQHGRKQTSLRLTSKEMK